MESNCDSKIHRRLEDMGCLRIMLRKALKEKRKVVAPMIMTCERWSQKHDIIHGLDLMTRRGNKRLRGFTEE